MPEEILIRKDGHIGWLLFNRPHVLNAMTIASWAAIDDALVKLERDRDIRVVILAGEGRAFCAGADVNELQLHAQQMSRGELSAGEMREMQKILQETTRKIRRSAHPFIAAIHGYAVGAGCEVTLACDLVVAGQGTRLGFPEVTVGVTITNGGTFFLPRMVGLAKARELAYTGEFITAEEAWRLGIVNRVVPDGEVRAVAEDLARRIASRAPIAVQLHKVMLDRALESSLEAALNFETEALVATALSGDHREGAKAFFEKRPAEFKGR